MGSSEMDKAAKEKEPKTPPAATTQEQSSTTNSGTVNADWSGFQGSYPFSPFAMPSPNGIVEASGNTPGGIETDGKPSEVKEKLPIKRSKGSLGSLNMITGKNNNPGKTLGASANGVYSKSAESGSEGTSEGSDANSQSDSQLKSGGRQDSGEGEASQNGSSAHGSQNGGPNARALVNAAIPVVPISTAGAATAVPGPTTNLHIGMDYWGAPASSTIPAMRGKVPSTPVAGGIVTPASRDSVQSQLWLQDERELKRQRRKQSNRESARRSRLRKQAECDELAQRAEALKEENASLRSEVSRIKSEYEQLLAENTSLKERLGEIPGHEELKSGRNDQHTNNNDGQKELVQGLNRRTNRADVELTDTAPQAAHRRLLGTRCSSFCLPRLGIAPDKYRARCLTMRASGESGDNLSPIAPVELESPVGQLLSQILKTHPHLLPAAIDQQLENLQSDKDDQKEEAAASQDLLYKRIAEVKEKERRRTLEEILYCLIVQKFVDNEISMIPKIMPTSDPTGRVDFWPNQEEKLERVHSPEAFEMIESHLSLVLGDRVVGPLSTIVQISKIKLGKLYAASIMYGYFLRRVDQRFQLERTMKTLPEDFTKDQARFEFPNPGKQLWDPDSLISIPPDDDNGSDGGGYMDTAEGKSYRLRSYVMYLDSETLQRYATIRSKEAISLIEKQTQALFGRPDIQVLDDGSLDTSSDEVVSITFAGLTMLVLEAVAFGSFLWDAESYVESKYHFLKS
ncbi:hypothetical protein CCACVL1_15029 [Corchorus capsularis]|uniref:BZIP domain-containing protein n=1 Tax=Corchorus capsularis TaxID=210143 RepID=A0A1R3I483_COCAP|nr:hypothetical protein CCACVL1_15029 [Corchorus capsularis]